MKRYVIIAIALVMALLFSSCVNVYKKGVEFPDYPNKDVKIYDDAIVYDYKGDDKECKITYGTQDDLKDVIEFYQNEFLEDDYVIINQSILQDEYTAEGYIDDTYFEINAEDARWDAKEYFEVSVEVECYLMDEDDERRVYIPTIEDATYMEVYIEGYSDEIELSFIIPDYFKAKDNDEENTKFIQTYGDSTLEVFVNGQSVYSSNYFDSEFTFYMSFDTYNLKYKPYDIYGVISKGKEIQKVGILNGLMVCDCFKGFDAAMYHDAQSLYMMEPSYITDYSGLSQLPNLEYLDIRYSSLMDFDHISHMSNLRYLASGGNEIKSLESIANLSNLMFLRLGECTAEDLSPLAELSNLKILRLGGHKAEDLSPIAQMTWLKLLNISAGNGDASVLDAMEDTYVIVK